MPQIMPVATASSSQFGSRGDSTESDARSESPPSLQDLCCHQLVDIVIMCTQSLPCSNARLPKNEEAKKWAISLEHLIASPYGAALFRAFLQREYAEENLDFILKVEEFKNTDCSRKRIRIAWKIYRTYIEIGSPHEINLDTVSRKVTELAMITPHLSTFDTAQKRCKGLLLHGQYPRFLEWDVYRKLAYPEQFPAEANPAEASDTYVKCQDPSLTQQLQQLKKSPRPDPSVTQRLQQPQRQRPAHPPPPRIQVVQPSPGSSPAGSIRIREGPSTSIPRSKSDSCRVTTRAVLEKPPLGSSSGRLNASSSCSDLSPGPSRQQQQQQLVTQPQHQHQQPKTNRSRSPSPRPAPRAPPHPQPLNTDK